MSVGSTVTALLGLSDRGTVTLSDLLTNAVAIADRALAAGTLVAGCSAPIADVGEVASALHQAEEACRHAGRGLRVASVVLFEDMNARFRLLQGQDEAALEDLYERTIAPLIAYDRTHHTRLVATLASLLEHRFAPQATARSLFIHRNTLQGRLERIERLLSVDLNDLEDVVELHLGLRAGELLGKPEIVRAARP
jgi:DNA-binding PucR family transcriptional regulator